MKSIKKFNLLHIFLIFALLVGLLSTSVLFVWSIINKYSNVEVSAAWKGEGTLADPWEMRTVEDIITLSNNVNNGTSYETKYFKLMNDINFSGKTFNGIGVEKQREFSGTFDGAGNTIRGLNIKPTSLSIDSYYVKAPSVVGVGLFGRLGWSAVIKNLCIVDSRFDASGLGNKGYYLGVGCIAGISKGLSVTIENCKIGDVPNDKWCTTKGPSDSNGGFHGGIVGIQLMDSLSHFYEPKTTPGLRIKNCETVGYYVESGYEIVSSIGPSYGMEHEAFGANLHSGYFSYEITGCLTDSYSIAEYMDPETVDNIIEHQLRPYINFIKDDTSNNVSVYVEWNFDTDKMEGCEISDYELMDLDYSAIGGASGSGITGGNTAYYRAKDYHFGLPTLRTFVDWRTLSFQAVNGTVSKSSIYIPSDAKIPVSNPSGSSITIYEQTVIGTGNEGCSTCLGWIYDGKYTYRVDFVKDYYYIYFNNIDGGYKAKCSTFESGTTKIKIYAGDSVNVECLHNNKTYTIIKYTIGSHVVQYEVDKKYCALSYGAIEINSDLMDIGKPIKPTLILIPVLDKNYGKLTVGTTYYITPTLQLKSYDVEVH